MLVLGSCVVVKTVLNLEIATGGTSWADDVVDLPSARMY
jgi:hypothetical protein